MTDVIVLGAGMAGLTAARTLAERGLRTMVIEARERVGGRVLSVPVAEGEAVELGAEFIHGRAPELWALIAEAGVQTTERGGTMLREADGGGLEEDDDDGTLFEPLEQLEDYPGEDMSFADWLTTSDVPAWAKPALTGYVEGFNAADAARIGIHSLGAQQKAEDATEGDRSWHVRGGYAQLAEHLHRRLLELGVEVRLNCKAQAVRWSAGEVVVDTTTGQVTATRCLVTLPLGVVQRINQPRGLVMQPEPPAVATAHRLAMGHATRFTLVFRECWWLQSQAVSGDVLQALNFIFTPQRLPPVWWTSGSEPEALPTLTGWVGGPRAATLEGRSADVLGAEACIALAEIFALPASVVRASLLSTHTHDWATDPFSLGAYSYVPTGAMDAPAAMGIPVQNTIYFAGEHTDVTGHWGTVHAAIRSGLRAAAQILGEAVAV